MAIEEKVIQPDSVTPAEQPVADTPSQPQAPDLSSVKAEYEAKLAAARKEATEAQEKFKGIKGKLDDVYKQKEEKRTKDLEEQGQWKTLWEEANKTAQEKVIHKSEISYNRNFIGKSKLKCENSQWDKYSSASSTYIIWLHKHNDKTYQYKSNCHTHT